MCKSLPENWQRVQIKDVSEKSQYGFTTKAVNEGDVYLLRTTDITNGDINWDQVPFCRENPDDLDKYRLEEGDMLISRAGSVGESFLINNLPHSNVVFASYLIRFKPTINKKYFKYFLQSPDYWNAITENQSGIAVPNVNATKLNSIELPLPPDETQHRIVEKIEELFSELDNGVENLKKAQKQLKTYRQAVLKDAFEGKLTKEWREQQDNLPTPDEILQQIKAERKAHRQHELAEWGNEVEQWKKDGKSGRKPRKPRKALSLDLFNHEELNDLDQLPENWTWIKIDKIIDHDQYSLKAGPFGSALKKEIYVKGGYKVYGQEQVIGGDHTIGDYYIAQKKYDKLSSCKVKPNDVLISLVGTIGKVLILPDEISPGVINPRLVKISLNANIYFPKFFKYYFESAYLKSLYSNKTHGATMDVLNLSIIKELPFPLLPKEEQGQIVQEIESRLSVVEQLERTIDENLQKAEALRQSILKKAFRGELVREDTVEIAEFQKSPQRYYQNKPTDLHAAIMCKIIDAHSKENQHLSKLNHVKCEKIIHMLESHEGIELERKPMKDAAGPDDYRRLRQIEHRAIRKNWFEKDETLGGEFGYGYKPKRSMEFAISGLESYGRLPIESINRMIELFLPMDKERAEVVATLYAAWNNFLIDGYQPLDEDIVRAAREEWSKQKLKIRRENFFKALKWMRKKNLIPSGKGKKVSDRHK